MLKSLGRFGIVGSLLMLAACGGGGGETSGGASPGNASTASVWTSGVFAPSSEYAARCASPRSGIDPYTMQRYADVQGMLLDENNWLRSWSNELYLWYSEIVDQNPALFSTTDAYFAILKTTAVMPSGRAKDRFHYTYTTPQWEALSSSDVDVGFGVYWELVSPTPPREAVVAYTQPNTAAAASTANLARGAKVLSVDGVDINADDANSIAALNAGLFPVNANETHTFLVQDAGATSTRSVTMVSADITSVPVPVLTTLTGADSAKVGYILFNDQLASSEAAMINAFTTLQGAAISDLVLDLRYNGGGYLDIASEVAYMIGGQTGVFETQQFNSKNLNTNPVAGGAITPVMFHNLSLGLSTTAGEPLPSLHLARVFVLAGTDTCSASEAIINGLRGVGVQVVLIGSTTCGKPYGFYPQDNCGTTYFSIEFSDVNSAGFGAYADGFTPVNSGNAYAAAVPGCAVGDDFSHALGNPAEARLASAMNYRISGTCPVATGVDSDARIQAARSFAESGGATLARPAWRALELLRTR